MRAIFLGCLVLLSVKAFALEQGQSPPDFTLPAVSNKDITLSALKGKVVYLDFWASWCGPCKNSMPWMKELKEKFGNQGFEILAVNLDTQWEMVDEFLKELGPNFPVLLDPTGMQPARFEIQAMPSSFLIGKDGKISSVHLGFHQKEKQEIEEEIEKLLAL